jgi:phosphatidate cytidylyltransferase
MLNSVSSSYPEILIRIASAVVLVPIVLWIVTLGGAAFLVLISVCVALLSLEWALMATPKMAARMSTAIMLTILCGLFSAYLGHPALALVILSFGTACSGLYAYRLKAAWLDAAYGALYIGIPAIVLIWLRESSDKGKDWVFFAFGIAWVADSAAYLIGKFVGGPKLWVKYSPNKTWSGFAGGLIAGMLAAGILSDITGVFKTSTTASLVGLLAALATMAGDFWESMLKRRYGVKDSGQLIPGHGGLLDRVDGLMFAILVIGAIKLVLVFEQGYV